MPRSRNARGLHLSSLAVLVHFLSFIHHFLCPCSLGPQPPPVNIHPVGFTVRINECQRLKAITHSHNYPIWLVSFG